MKKILLLFVILIFSATAFACSPATATQTLQLPAASVTIPVTVEAAPTTSNGAPQTEVDVPRISVEDAAAALKNGDAIILDVRSAEAYQASHIPGALSIPLEEIETNPAGLNLDKSKWIITYCT